MMILMVVSLCGRNSLGNKKPVIQISQNHRHPLSNETKLLLPLPEQQQPGIRMWWVSQRRRRSCYNTMSWSDSLASGVIHSIHSVVSWTLKMLFLSSSSFQFQFHFISMLRFPGIDHWETETLAEVITLEVGSCNENYMRITSWRNKEN